MWVRIMEISHYYFYQESEAHKILPADVFLEQELIYADRTMHHGEL